MSTRWLLAVLAVTVLGCATAAPDDVVTDDYESADGDGARWSSDPDVIAACELQVSGETAVQACLDRVGFARTRPSRLISSCGDYTYGDAAFFDCLDIAMNLQLSPSTVDECYEITISEDEFFACLED